MLLARGEKMIRLSISLDLSRPPPAKRSALSAQSPPPPGFGSASPFLQATVFFLQASRW